MNTENQAVSDQGSDAANLKQIEQWLDQDLSRLVSLINAMHQDKDLKKFLVKWFHGRMENHRQAEKAKNQTELFANGKPA